MGTFKKGALKLATKTEVPIIPISINGTYTILEEKGYLRSHQPVDIIIHPAVPTKGLNRHQEKELNDQIYTIVKKGVDTLKARREQEENQ